jgi:predicted RNA-binding Zn-ribbon protein involved in translation (DUF1610 family)
MEKVVYLILSREKDTFNVLYVGDCEKTEDSGFFTKNAAFKCWIDKSGSEKFLYLAIYPIFDSDSGARKHVISKIITRYNPVCNTIPEEKPDYAVRSSNPDISKLEKSESEKITCPCCGSEMRVERVLEKSSIVKCPECGLSDTKLNS